MKTLLDSVTVTVEEIDGKYVAKAIIGNKLYKRNKDEKEFKSIDGKETFNTYLQTWISICIDPQGDTWGTCSGKTISASSTRDYAAVAALFDELKKLAIGNLKEYGEFITPAHLEDEAEFRRFEKRSEIMTDVDYNPAESPDAENRPIEVE